MERSGILNNSCMTRECLCDLIISPLPVPLYRVTFYNLEESSSVQCGCCQDMMCFDFSSSWDLQLPVSRNFIRLGVRLPLSSAHNATESAP